MTKVYYVPIKNDLVGYFEELPVLSSNSLCYENDEYIFYIIPKKNNPLGYFFNFDFLLVLFLFFFLFHL